MDEISLFGEYLQNIQEQPKAVRDTVAALAQGDALRRVSERVKNDKAPRIVLTGMGASYHALQPLELELVGQGLNARRIETSELIYHAPRLLNSQALVVAVSQSGQSVEILKLLDRKTTDHFDLVGVTNTPHSPLAKAADTTLLTHAGSEYSVSSKTYVATLAALELVGAMCSHQEAAACSEQLFRAADAMEHYLVGWREYVTDLKRRLESIQQMVLVGRGPSLAAVGTGALIIREAAHFPCQELSSAAFRHGPIEMVSPELFVLVFSGTSPTVDLNLRLAADIRSGGGTAEIVDESSGPNVFSLPAVPPAGLPLLEILVPQMISLALARLRGRVPGKFERIGKITTTE